MKHTCTELEDQVVSDTWDFPSTSLLPTTKNPSEELRRNWEPKLDRFQPSLIGVYTLAKEPPMEDWLEWGLAVFKYNLQTSCPFCWKWHATLLWQIHQVLVYTLVTVTRLYTSLNHLPHCMHIFHDSMRWSLSQVKKVFCFHQIGNLTSRTSSFFWLFCAGFAR